MYVTSNISKCSWCLKPYIYIIACVYYTIIVAISIILYIIEWNKWENKPYLFTGNVILMVTTY